MKVQAESFHLNGHIIGFRSQTEKLESPYKIPSSTLAVKGLIITINKKKLMNFPIDFVVAGPFEKIRTFYFMKDE